LTHDDLNDIISSLKEQIAQIREDLDHLKRFSNEMKISGDISPRISDEEKDLRHDIHCIKYELRKMKSYLRDEGLGGPILEERGIDVVPSNDVDELREQANQALRQSSEAQEELDKVRSKLEELQKKVDEAANEASSAKNLLERAQHDNEVAKNISEEAKDFISNNDITIQLLLSRSGRSFCDDSQFLEPLLIVSTCLRVHRTSRNISSRDRFSAPAPPFL
jgi:methyl-accepting chemotaxis protein